MTTKHRKARPANSESKTAERGELSAKPQRSTKPKPQAKDALRPASESETSKKAKRIAKSRSSEKSKPKANDALRVASKSTAAKKAKSVTKPQRSAKPKRQAKEPLRAASDLTTPQRAKRVAKPLGLTTPRTQPNDPSSLRGWSVRAALLLAVAILGYHLVQMHQRLETIQTELNMLRVDAVQAKRRTAKLEDVTGNLQGNLGDADAERRALQRSLQQTASQMKRLDDSAEQIQSLLEHRLGRLEALQSELDDARRTAKHGEARARTSQSALAEMQGRLKAMQAGLEAHQQASLQTTSKAEGLQTKLEEGEQTAERAKAHAAKSRSQNDALQRRLKAMQAELDTHQRAALEATSEVERYKERAQRLESKLKRDGHARALLEKELDEAKSQNAQLKETLLIGKRFLPKLAHTTIAYPPHGAKTRDYLIRTIAFEAGGENELGKVAVAHVVLNRVRSGKWGNSVEDVVTSPWQFEPWMTRRKELKKLHPFDPRFRKAAEVADAVLAGEIPDPTAGATHFLNPVVVRQRRGGSLPLWARRKGQPIGRHVFYAPNDHDAEPESDDASRVSAAHPTRASSPAGPG